MRDSSNVAYKRFSKVFFGNFLPALVFLGAVAVWAAQLSTFEFFLTIGILLIFSPALYGEWLFDDWAIVDNEPDWKAPISNSLRYIWWEVSHRPFILGHGGERWFTMLGNHITYKLWGFNPAAWHGVNLAIHAGAVLILHRLALGWGASPYAAAAMAVILAVHPLQVGSVAYISGRAGLQSVFLTLAGLWCFQLGAWPASIVLQYLAWRSKEDSMLFWVFYPICYFLFT